MILCSTGRDIQFFGNFLYFHSLLPVELVDGLSFWGKGFNGFIGNIKQFIVDHSPFDAINDLRAVLNQVINDFCLDQFFPEKLTDGVIGYCKDIVVEVETRIHLASLFPEADKYFLYQIVASDRDRFFLKQSAAPEVISSKVLQFSSIINWFLC